MSIKFEKTYWPSGLLKQEIPFEGGNINGLVRTYYDNGENWYFVNYKNDKLQGYSKHWYNSSKLLNTKNNLIYERNYSDGLVEGEYINYEY